MSRPNCIHPRRMNTINNQKILPKNLSSVFRSLTPRVPSNKSKQQYAVQPNVIKSISCSQQHYALAHASQNNAHNNNNKSIRSVSERCHLRQTSDSQILSFHFNFIIVEFKCVKMCVVCCIQSLLTTLVAALYCDLKIDAIHMFSCMALARIAYSILDVVGLSFGWVCKCVSENGAHF